MVFVKLRRGQQCNICRIQHVQDANVILQFIQDLGKGPIFAEVSIDLAWLSAACELARAMLERFLCYNGLAQSVLITTDPIMERVSGLFF